MQGDGGGPSAGLPASSSVKSPHFWSRAHDVTPLRRGARCGERGVCAHAWAPRTRRRRRVARAPPCLKLDRHPLSPPTPHPTKCCWRRCCRPQMSVKHPLAALAARAATAPKTSLCRTPIRRPPSDARDWPRDARAPLSVSRCRVPAQLALPYRASWNSPACRCGSAGPAASRVPSSCWHACEGRPSLGAAPTRR